MKKIVLLLILAAMVCAFSFANAESLTDLASWPDQDLLATRDLLNEEIFKRGIEAEIDFYPGAYVCGKDIREGSYVIGLKSSESLVFVTIYENEEDFRNGENYITFETMHPDTSGCYVSLKEGMVLDVEESDKVELTIKQVKNSLMP